MEPHDLLDKVMNKDEFSTSNWKMRRDIIRKSLVFCAVLFTVILFVVFVLLVLKPDAKYDQNLVAILQGALSTLGFLAISIIGTYIGGATWDTTSYRNSVSNIAATVSNTTTNRTQFDQNIPVNNTNDIDPDAISNVVPKRKRRIRPTTGEPDLTEAKG